MLASFRSSKGCVESARGEAGDQRSSVEAGAHAAAALELASSSLGVSLAFFEINPESLRHLVVVALVWCPTADSGLGLGMPQFEQPSFSLAEFTHAFTAP